MTGPSGLGRRAALKGALAAAGAGLAGCLGGLGGKPPAERVEGGTDVAGTYADLGAALRDGYRTTRTYVRTGGGAMGVPFINLDVGELDPERPRTLLYDLTGVGAYELVGAEWFEPADAADGPPSMFGKEFHPARDGHYPGQPRHYGLHVWLASENPDGLFADVNPALSPPPFMAEVTAARDALVRFTPAEGGADRAKEVGYRNTETHVETDRGAYGVPFVNPDADGTDPAEPPILLYRVTESWFYDLLGAEWYVPADAADGPPTMFGRPFHGPMEGHSPKADQPRHYGLHAWLFRANPEGMFAPFNPRFA